MVYRFLLLMLLSLMLSACSSEAKFKPHQEGGVTIYCQTTFDQGKDGFYASKRAKITLVNDAISGKALQTICKEKWAGPAVELDIKGSKGLKIAFMAQGIGFKTARLNFFDEKARDNTTPYGYRFLPDYEWTPVLYYVDLFRYNSKSSGHVRKDTHFSTLRFWGPDPKGKNVALILDNFVVYRGKDTLPPGPIANLTLEASPVGIKLSWSPAQDNVFPMVYVISRAEGNGPFRKIAESYKPQYLDQDVKKGRRYRYRVLACDFENNLGPWSEVKSITFDFETPENLREITVYEKDRAHYAAHIRKVHESGKGRVKKGLVVLFGDSLTGPTLYPRLVAGALGIYRVKAYGFAGQTTGFGRRKIKEILAKERPEFIFIMFGTNNVRGKLRTVDVYKKWVDDLEVMVKEAEAQGTVAALATIPPRGFKDPLSLPEALFNEVLIERAHKLEIPVAYIFESIQQAGERRRFIWKDGVHWTPQGMELAAWTWRETMRQIEFALRDKP